LKKYDIYFALFGVATAFFVIGTALSIGLGTARAPAPGFVPLIAGILLLVLSLVLLVAAIRARKGEPDFRRFPTFRSNVFINCAVLFAYSLSLELLGFVVGTALLLFYLFKVPGGRTWRFSAIVTCIVVLSCYYFFGVLLQTQLPRGVFRVG
jgi:putative tricarboxylic transport membrane protein